MDNKYNYIVACVVERDGIVLYLLHIITKRDSKLLQYVHHPKYCYRNTNIFNVRTNKTITESINTGLSQPTQLTGPVWATSIQQHYTDACLCYNLLRGECIISLYITVILSMLLYQVGSYSWNCDLLWCIQLNALCLPLTSSVRNMPGLVLLINAVCFTSTGRVGSGCSI